MKKNRGLTLIELLIALIISGILIGALYRTFIGQQKTYTVQEQVVDMQQNLRAGLNKMVKEIRMAGFGNVSIILPMTTVDGKTLPHIINPGNNSNYVNQNDDQITIIGALEQVSTLKTVGTNMIELNGNASRFNTDANNKYICIGGLETHTVTNIVGNTITLSSNLKNNYNIGDPVFKVKAITFQLRWDNRNPQMPMPILSREDLTEGGGSQPLAENIENLQFIYTLVDGTETDSPANPADIRMVKVTVTARTIADPELKDGSGYRKRQIASNVLIRNMGLSP